MLQRDELLIFLLSKKGGKEKLVIFYALNNVSPFQREIAFQTIIFFSLITLYEHLTPSSIFNILSYPSLRTVTGNIASLTLDVMYRLS